MSKQGAAFAPFLISPCVKVYGSAWPDENKPLTLSLSKGGSTGSPRTVKLTTVFKFDTI
jgi:hypothetical protein